ncbi:Cytidine deaminase [Anaerovibrio sp. JC8]|uniref:cytidine deaminase n=1 Tax=Anaerovibrio sp. JC8 TaxID=1240085 RepID=UPI000A0C5BEC|nr:cytidine deaminase [Anaerovibrio sp. JC8]ORU01127.1 Cytidine deaminase [Anaerovibrio sp. JC8]
MLNEDICDTMIKMAKDARMKSYSPYTKIKVGACILASDGTLYGGCKVENGSSSLSVCAERAAVYKAVSDGKQEFDAIAVVADTESPFVPCGGCLQVMAEFDIPEIVMANLDGDIRVMQLEELAPFVKYMGVNHVKERYEDHFNVFEELE